MHVLYILYSKYSLKQTFLLLFTVFFILTNYIQVSVILLNLLLLNDFVLMTFDSAARPKWRLDGHCLLGHSFVFACQSIPSCSLHVNYF